MQGFHLALLGSRSDSVCVSVACRVLQVQPEALTMLAEQAMIDIAHLLRPAHLQQLRKILDDPEASKNDRFVALELLKNANIAAAMVLPGTCTAQKKPAHEHARVSPHQPGRRLPRHRNWHCHG